MNSATLALLIPIVAIVCGALISIMKMKTQQQKNNRKQQASQDELKQEIAKLRERIEVLEALAVDEQQQLRREIDALKRA
ncbi:MAG: hypothetical protein ACRCT7_01945 [Shewanella sp.]|uniref:hypothetical protein n=1 Tax=Shewanella sp. SNU WT4 TaxID=2590015 RepID=UPI001125C5BB|nr:hypothetical protein [Shewanella sp. SNU WT4]QDF65350.1 hypothetical protein FJQ87_00445 [Shewanella sp. SNU WT4]